ncbi:MAG: hypothetical protein GY820_40430 [Gammaproteobacteria bacterium]|nr:hypothetical protein [Gammaproteobacteria bacterium]
MASVINSPRVGARRKNRCLERMIMRFRYAMRSKPVFRRGFAPRFRKTERAENWRADQKHNQVRA